MLTDHELLQLREGLKLSKRVVAEIKHIRPQGPSRGVRSARGSFSGRYPSRNMRSSIQLESCRCELPYLYQIEHDNKVLEFYQPSF